MSDIARPVMIDGLNVAWWCGTPPTLRLPLTLILALYEQGRTACMVFDASAPYQLPEAERELYAELAQHTSCCVQVPSGQDADVHMLKQARDTHACIVTRDQFRDHRRKYRSLIKDTARILRGDVAENVLRVPALDIAAPLPDLPRQAWQRLLCLPRGGPGALSA